MQIACCQTDIVWENKAANFEKVRTLLKAAVPRENALLLLPEMFSTGFSMNVPLIAESKERPAEQFVSGMARELKIFILAGVVTAGADGKGRNEAVLFGPDGHERTRYQKMHPFSLAGETHHFSAGDEVRIFEWQSMTAAPFICYDLRFPEVFRTAVKRGAQLFVVIANWPRPRDAHWLALLKARAIENQAYVAGVNRCGKDPAHTYAGRSVIVDPHGEVIADAGDRECVISAEADLAGLLSYRRNFPPLRDMR